jgi:hypothetical protein
MNSENRTDVGRRLAGVEVLDGDGAPVALGDLWRDETAVLVFVRHFG